MISWARPSMTRNFYKVLPKMLLVTYIPYMIQTSTTTTINYNFPFLLNQCIFIMLLVKRSCDCLCLHKLFAVWLSQGSSRYSTWWGLFRTALNKVVSDDAVKAVGFKCFQCIKRCCCFTHYFKDMWDKVLLEQVWLNSGETHTWRRYSKPISIPTFRNTS